MTTQAMSSIRLPTTQRWATYSVLVVVGLSGLAWSLLHDVLQWGWMLSERRLLITHGVSAAITLVVVGGLLPLHIRLALRVKRNIRSGITALTLMALLGSTGILLYYGGEDWRDGVRWTHIILGTVACLAVPIHVWLGRKRQGYGHAHQAKGQVKQPST